MIRQLLSIATVLLCASVARCADTPPDDKKLDAMIKALGSDDFKEREDATVALKAVGQPAKPALEKELAASKDAEVRARVTKLLDYLKPYLTLAMLNETERSIVALELPDLKEGAESAIFTMRSTAEYQMLDIGNIRVAVKGSGVVEGGIALWEPIEINSTRAGGHSSAMVTNGRKTSSSYSNGVSTITTPEVTLKISDGVMEIDGQKVKFETTGKVIFVDEKGKFEKLYDFAKDVESKSAPSPEPKK